MTEAEACRNFGDLLDDVGWSRWFHGFTINLWRLCSPPLLPVDFVPDWWQSIPNVSLHGTCPRITSANVSWSMHGIFKMIFLKLWFWIATVRYRGGTMAGADQQLLVWKAALVRQREDRIRHIEVGHSSGVQHPDLYPITYCTRCMTIRHHYHILTDLCMPSQNLHNRWRKTLNNDRKQIVHFYKNGYKRGCKHI